MSKENKFNPGIYTQAGRLPPDEDARERKKQGTGVGTKRSSESGGTKPARKKKRGLPK
jgi:hypothetical protein